MQTRTVALLLSAGLLLSGCSGGDADTDTGAAESPSPSPSTTVDVPEGVTLTEAGSELAFGDNAVVVYEADQKRGTVLQLRVQRVVKGSIKDFSSFILNDKVRASTPYYVHVRVRNLGRGDIGGADVPLWGVDSRNTLLPAAQFTTAFTRCPSEPLPKKFGADAAMSTCLVYLAPKGATLEAVSFRPTQEFDPITWDGKILTPEPKKKEPTKKKKPGGKRR